MVISDDVWGIQALFLLKLGIHFPHSLQKREWTMISSFTLYVLKMEDLEIMKFLSSKGNTVPYFRFIFIRRSMLTRKSLIKEVRKLTCPYITEKSPKIIQLVIINFEILKISLYKKNSSVHVYLQRKYFLNHWDVPGILTSRWVYFWSDIFTL